MPPRFLFLPVSGSTGGGEYTRCLTLAEAIPAAWPEAEIEFVLNRQAGYAKNCPYRTHLIGTSPTYATEDVNRILNERRPQVAIFDNSGRAAQWKAARQLGVRTVFISSRASTRCKGFGLRRLPWLDQHWIVAPPLIRPKLSALERLKLRMIHRPENLFIDWIFVPPEPARSSDLFHRLGVGPGNFLVASAGSGGKAAGPDLPIAVFARAAARIAVRTGLRAIVVCGDNSQRPEGLGRDVLFLDTVSRHEMVDLLSEARLLVTNGGSVFIEGVAFGRVCVAVSLATDQKTRVRAFSNARLAVEAPLSDECIARLAMDTIEHAETFDGISERLSRRPIVNGLDTALGCLHRLVHASGPSLRYT